MRLIGNENKNEMLTESIKYKNLTAFFYEQIFIKILNRSEHGMMLIAELDYSQ
jgi:hypothetical protein